MAGFHPGIPKHLFEGRSIERVLVGAMSLTFQLEEGKLIRLQPFGATDDRDNWLCKLPVCGDDSLQAFVNQTIERITFLAAHHATIRFSGGKVLELVNEIPPVWEMVEFVIGDDWYEA